MAGLTKTTEITKEEVLKYVEECFMCDMYDIFDICRERHNKAMMSVDNKR